jgi:hypothetical protein
MSRRSVWRIPALVLTVAAPSAAGEGPPAELAVVGGRRIDGYGAPPLENAVVLIRGDSTDGGHGPRRGDHAPGGNHGFP